MDAEVKKKWVDALRSGQFVQGKFNLRNVHNEYCCLGVLACVTGLPAEDDQTGLGQESYLALADLIGMEDSADLRKLTERNDGVGEFKEKPQTFNQIADWIEANL